MANEAAHIITPYDGRAYAELGLQRGLRADTLPWNRGFDRPLGHLPQFRRPVFTLFDSASSVSVRQRQNAGHLADDIDQFTA